MPQPSAEILRGTFDLLILRALSWGPAHGDAIARWIELASLTFASWNHVVEWVAAADRLRAIA